jgi:two-component system LytT family response regulator
MIPFDEIDWVSADGDYVRVHAGKRRLMLRLTMHRLAEALPPTRHVRIHRSTIVNVARIRSLRSLPNAEYAVVLVDGVVLRASRSYADRLRVALGLTS